jgi:hypothetical protein
MIAKEPFNNTHKVHLATLGGKTKEESFNRRIFRELDKVIDVETKGQRHQCDNRQRIQGVKYKSCIETQVLKQWGEPDQPEDGVNFVIPMLRAAPKSVERPFKRLIFIRGGFGIAARGANNSNLVGRKDVLTECIFTITLMKGMMRCNRNACEETERILMEDRGEFVTFLPNTVFMVPKNNNARLGTKWAEILILLDSEDTHGGDSPRSHFFLESLIFTQRNLLIHVKVLDAMLFFKEAFKPNLPVGCRDECLPTP